MQVHLHCVSMIIDVRLWLVKCSDGTVVQSMIFFKTNLYSQSKYNYHRQNMNLTLPSAQQITVAIETAREDVH